MAMGSAMAPLERAIW